jgi:hypothetical protein
LFPDDNANLVAATVTPASALYQAILNVNDISK